MPGNWLLTGIARLFFADCICDLCSLSVEIEILADRPGAGVVTAERVIVENVVRLI